nr:universal stress protein [Saprospiraceae bacterium]
MNGLNVVIPTDFSVQAEYAYLMVKNLETKIPINIHFLHVMQVPETVTMDVEGNIFTCGEIDAEYVETQRDIAQRKLNNLKTLYGDNIKVHLKLGKINDSILEFSKEQKMDLIVMGTKGAFGLKEKLSGSSAQMLARKSTTPVLSLMCDRSDLQINNILLVHDFSKPEKLDLDVMHKMIESFSCKLHFLHILSDKHHSNVAALSQKADEFAQLNHIQNYEFHTVNDKDVESGVVHFNQMQDMDIICIGTHGKGGIFHTSATEKLINH